MYNKKKKPIKGSRLVGEYKIKRQNPISAKEDDNNTIIMLTNKIQEIQKNRMNRILDNMVEFNNQYYDAAFKVDSFNWDELCKLRSWFISIKESYGENQYQKNYYKNKINNKKISAYIGPEFIKLDDELDNNELITKYTKQLEELDIIKEDKILYIVIKYNLDFDKAEGIVNEFIHFEKIMLSNKLATLTHTNDK